MKRSTGFWGALLLGLGVVQAQEKPDEPEPYVIVVTGSRTERRASEATVVTEVIDQREIRLSGTRDLGRLLEGHSGVSIDRTFRGAGIRMQGLDPEHVLVLVDGERIAGRLGTTLDLSRLRMEEFERVEIVKGASSALYGADAMGGVVNLVPKRCLLAEGELQLRGTSLSQADVGGSLAQPLGAACLRLSGHFLRGPALMFDQPGPGTVIDGILEGSLGARLEWAPNARLKLLLAANIGQSDSSGVDQSATGAVFDRLTRLQNFDLTLRPEYRFPDGSRLSFSARQSFFRHQLHNDQRLSDQLDQYQDTHAQLWQGTLQYERSFGERHAFTAGLEGYHESLSSPRLEGGEGGRTRLSVFAQDEWQVLSGMLQIVPGARLDGDFQFGLQFSPRLAARWDPHPSVTVRAGAGLGFRPASFQELLLRFENSGVGYVVEGNPELLPERSRNVNAGIEWRPLKRLVATLDVFRNDVDDLITNVTLPRTGIGPSRYSYTNVAEAQVDGIEGGLRLRPLTGLRIDIAHAIWLARDLTLDRALEGRPRHRSTLRAGWLHSKWGLETGANLTLVGERPQYTDADADGVDETSMLPAYAQIDLRIAKRLGSLIDLNAGVDNLLDAGDPSSLPITPRSFYLGLSARH